MKKDLLDDALKNLRNTDSNNIRKINTRPDIEEREGRINKAINKSIRTSKKPWEISDKSLAQYIGEIEDESTDDEVDVESYNKKVNTITDHNKIAKLLGF